MRAIDSLDPGRGLLPAVGDGVGLVLVGRGPGLVDLGEGHVDDFDAHAFLDGRGDARPIAADGQDLRFLHLLQTIARGEDRQIIGRDAEGAGNGSRRAPGCGHEGAEIVRHSALFHLPKSAAGGDEVLGPRRGDKAEVGRFLAQEVGRVDEEAAAPPVLEIDVERGSSRAGDRLDDAVPAIELDDDGAVEGRGRVIGQDLLGLFRPLGHGGREFPGREGLDQGGRGPVHDRLEVEAHVGPIGPGLDDGMERIDDAQAELLRFRAGLE